MHTTSICVATIALLSSFVVAEPERPKFYFPRQVKRQIVNNLTGPLTTPARSPSLTVPRDSSTSKRQVTDTVDTVDTVLGIFGVGTGTAAGTGAASTSDSVKTIVIQSTVVVGDGGSTITPSSAATTTDAGSAAAPSTTASGITFVPSGVLTAPTTSLTDTTTSPTDTTTTSTTADAPPSIVFSLQSVLTGVTGVVNSILAPTTTSSAAADQATPISSSAAGNVLSTVVSVLAPSITPAFTISPVAGTTVTPPSSSDGGLPSSVITIPNPISTVTPTVVIPGFPSSSIAPSATVSPIGIVPTDSLTFGVTSIGVTGVTGPVTAPTISPTAIVLTDGNSTSVPVPLPTGSPSDVTSSILPTVTPAILTGTPLGNGTTTATSEPVVVSPTITSSQAPQTIQPIATNTEAGTTAWIVASIAVQSSTSIVLSTATTASGIPTSLPQVISPPEGMPSATPNDMTLVQVGFNYKLNYDFVVNTPNSSVQIFHFLPIGVSDGLSIKLGQVIMQKLYPYDTQHHSGYITTLATFFIPKNMVDTLGAMLKTPLSPLYENPDQSVATLMSYIDSSFPLIPGTSVDTGTTTGTAKGVAPTETSTQGGGGVFSTDSQTTTTASKGTAIGAAVGAIGAAAAYGAAMFFIARRYKKRRASHRRSSSIQNPSEMRFTGSSPALMGGAIMSGGLPDGRESRGSGRSGGQSARTAQISAPMMAENSLGWN